MLESRHFQRVPFRLDVSLFEEDDNTPIKCKVRDIALGGLFADGAAGIQPGQSVRVVIYPGTADALHLDARVARVGPRGAGCEFVGNSPATMEVLAALLTPSWDGENLLDGVVQFAPWADSNNLSGWMRLTSMVSDWQRLTQRPV